jgi:hypothetical protein
MFPVADFLQSATVQANVLSIDIYSDTVQLVINVTAKAGDIVGYGVFDTLENLGAMRTLGFTTSAISATDGVSHVDLSVESALKMFLVQAVVAAEQADSNVESSTCTNPERCAMLLEAVQDLAPLFTKPATLLASLCLGGLCQGRSSNTVVLNAATKSSLALVLSTSTMAARTGAIATNLHQLDLSTGADKTFFDTVAAALSDAQDSIVDVTDPGPTIESFQGVQVLVGQRLSLQVWVDLVACMQGILWIELFAPLCCLISSTVHSFSTGSQRLLLLLNLNNRAIVTQTVYDAVLSVPFFVAVSNLQLSQADSRRRASSGIDVQVRNMPCLS